MTVNADLARIFGSDADAISLAPYGTALPDSIDAALSPAFEDVGWLNSDGIAETLTGSVNKIRGFQGNGVVRTSMSEPGSQIGFTALETKAQTQSLRYHEKQVTVTGGVRKAVRGAGQTIKVRTAVIDLFDADDDTIKDRFIIPRFEIAPNGDRTATATDIAGFPFLGEIVGDYTHFSTVVGQLAAVWSVVVSGSPTSGTYTLTVAGYSTAPIAYNASAANVAAAINALSGVTGITGVTASGTSTITVTFPAPALLAAGSNNLDTGTVTVTAP